MLAKYQCWQELSDAGNSSAMPAKVWRRQKFAIPTAKV